MLERKFIATHTWPLVVRELRAESRRPVIYWLRLLTAAVVVSVLTGFVATTALDASQLGGALFGVLGHAVLYAIWIIVPMMTADCVSREKREGTLGLLFLTPLTLLDVLLGKAASHNLRAVSLLLAAVPVVILPLVLGGVRWQEAVIALATTFSALMLAMAAGLFASAKGGSAIQVMVMSEIYAGILAAYQFICYAPCRALGLNVAGFVIVLAVFTLGAFAFMISASARVLKNTWDQDSASPERPKWVDLFSNSELCQMIFRWKHSRTLDRNPIAWLQEYSWTAKLTKWGWFLSLMFAEYCAMFAFPGCQPQFITILSLGVAFSATGSFRRERQTGLLEVLLVTPLTVRQLMAGRLWGILCHFSPALAITITCWNGDRLMNHHEYEVNPFSPVIPNPLAFVALMVVGLYLSLWRINFFLAWLLTWTAAFLIPSAAMIALAQRRSIPSSIGVGMTSLFQIALVVVCWLLMRRNMEQRRFVNNNPA